MKKTKFSHKVMAIFLTLTFLPSVMPMNYLYASNNGPNAPEAASFEPVDATDMVNLVTGDMSYVLPLMNVPSPEGGYPLSLSYHAGIAMDQQASWVGLGWNLNPGAINRGVNGYPDDWGKTNVNEFFFDEGYDEDIYSFSAGATFKNTVSVGLGASWGSHRSLGGYVSAGYAFSSGASLGGSIGTNGVSINGGYSAGGSGLNGSIGTNGVGIGYGTSTGKEGGTTLGASLNYNFNQGLSGGISASQKNGNFGKDGQGPAKVSSLGINFSANGASVNVKANGYGAGVSLGGRSASSGDWDINQSTRGFYLPAYIFYVGYSHTRIKYSLFKYNNLFTSGMLNPVASNKLKPYFNSNNLSRLLEENHFMDVNVLPKFDESLNLNTYLSSDSQFDKNNLVLPNYDNYQVAAQGLSGTLRPEIHSELNLSGRGRGEQNDDGQYMAYLNNDISEYNSPTETPTPVNTDAVNKIEFTMNNAYNSFLRYETGKFLNRGFSDESSINDQTALAGFTTRVPKNEDGHSTQETTGNFDNSNSLINNRKLEGNHIQTYTNKEIREGLISGFIEAKGVDRQKTEIFIDEGIGGYQITSLDGKTYHYSLPVYNFESFYKNFEETDDEDTQFFEIQKTKPFATHWLLTAVTGPDYIDTNMDGEFGKNDYGYWVEFEYGKWTDGYIWETPSGRYHEDEDLEGNKTYSYSWGRKQVYYLDAVKTRTHTALFVKGLREDNISASKHRYNEKWVNGSFWQGNYSKEREPNKRYKTFAEPGDTFYYLNSSQEDTSFEFSDDLGQDGCRDIKSYSAQSTKDSEYFDIEKSYSLKLDKIILLKNEDLTNFDKSQDNTFITTKTGTFYKNVFYKNINADSGEGTCFLFGGYDFYLRPPNKSLKVFEINRHADVLDNKDIENFNLEEKAQQIISLDYDYSLARGSSNSESISKGRLVLKKVNFKGKQGIQLIPPYEFGYSNFSTNYNSNNEDDWGYNKTNPAAWSLNKITTPTGSNIKVKYEEDSYYAEAATFDSKIYENVSFNKEGNLVEVTFDNNLNLSDYFKIGKEVGFSFTRSQWVNFADPNNPSTLKTVQPKDVHTTLEALNINGNILSLGIKAETKGFEDSNAIGGNNCVFNTGQSYCYANLKIKNNKAPLYSTLDANGRTGGGLRVKSLEVLGDTNSVITEYLYTDPNTNNTSGITSYAPTDEAKAIPYVSELPSPVVMYGHVKMINKDSKGKLLGSTQYEFETLKPDNYDANLINLGAFRVVEQQNQEFVNGKVLANKYTIYNSLGNLGRLLSVSTYNGVGNLLSSTSNKYKTSLDSDGEIGVTQESHKSLKRIKKNSEVKFLASSTSKVSYPSVLESTTTHQGNFSKTTTYDKYDFLTGQVLETTSVNSEGKEFKSQTFPAYIEYTKMGSKIDNPANKNMLVQERMNITSVKEGNDWEEIAAGITTWKPETYVSTTILENGVSLQENHDVWRKHKSFIWDGITNDQGLFTNYSDDDKQDDGFNWNLEVNDVDVEQPNQWKQVSEISKYDEYSMPLEVIDINGNKAATRMSDKDSKVIAVSNAGYDEMIYSGAEYRTSNKFDAGNIDALGQSEEKAHTGNFSVKISSQQGFKTYLSGHKAGEYKISVWASKDNYDNARINDGSGVKEFNGEEVIAGDWVMLNHYVDLTAGSKNIYVTSNSGTTYFDDFRIHPVESSMTSYVYNEWDELSYVIGANNLGTHYEYDEAGRLLRTSAELVNNGLFKGGFKPSAEYRYNYKGIGEIDENGNGSVDPNEGFDPLFVGRSPQNGLNNPGTLTILPSGGSGQFTFRFAQGSVSGTSSEVSQQVDALQFGTPTSNNQIFVDTVPCIIVNDVYNAYAVRVLVKDTVTGDEKTGLYYYNRECSDDNGNDETPQQ